MIRAPAPPVVLVAHGSRDPRSAATMRRLASAVAASWPASVTAAFLDFNLPSVPWALRGLAPGAARSSGATGAPIVIPALLTSAYHGRVDVPEVLAATGVPAVRTGVLGLEEPGDEPDPLLLAALRRRLSELGTTYDGLVLLAAGTSHSAARSTVESVAAALSVALYVPCTVGYASASPPSGAEAVAMLRSLGATRVVAASYFLAPGRLYDAAAASARSGGAVGVAAPLGAAEEVVRLVLARATSAGAAAPHQTRGDHEVTVPNIRRS